MMEAVRRLNGNRRFALLGLVAALLVGAAMVGRWATAPQFITLYRDLDLQEASQITESLTKASVTYRLADGGTRIEVAVADGAKSRVLLAKDGLPSRGRPGMELFDKPTWGMTDFTQRITYRRALEGELARTVGSLQGVERAQVHLALPEASPLRRLERPAEAAVVLTLRPGVSITPDIVRGIAMLVSSSVEQLSSDHVAVLDDQGRMLDSPSEDGNSLGLSSRQLELQQSVEKHLAGKVTELLTPVLGAGRVRSQVSARLNFGQVDRTIEEYDPDKQVLANEQRSEGGTDASSGSDTPTVMNNTFLNSRRIDKLVGEVGNVTRLTVSVMVDAASLESGPAQEAQRSRLEALAKNAIGFDSTRGDQLALVAIPFTTPAPPVVGTIPDSSSGTDRIIVVADRLGRPVIGILALLAAFVLGWRALRQGNLAQPAPALAAPAVSAGLVAKAVAPTPANIQLRNRIASDTLDAPETAAKVIRAWLAEDA